MSHRTVLRAQDVKTAVRIASELKVAGVCKRTDHKRHRNAREFISNSVGRKEFGTVDLKLLYANQIGNDAIRGRVMDMNRHVFCIGLSTDAFLRSCIQASEKNRLLQPCLEAKIQLQAKQSWSSNERIRIDSRHPRVEMWASEEGAWISEESRPCMLHSAQNLLVRASD